MLSEIIKTFRSFFCINREYQNSFRIETVLESGQRGKSAEADPVFQIRSIIFLDCRGFHGNNKKDNVTFPFTWAA